ncbi:stress-induced-phosphoprotein 1-like [Liolophura sinensis]|uniref:stress-induced-phosphoprotein 1-like n=1 Tax=Liolophura sinensis TaxID=3198878 RepID=UPI003158707F
MLSPETSEKMAEAQKQQVEELKNKGNKALEAGDCEEAVSLYTSALNLSPKNHVLYSNRSAAYAKAGKYLEALDDAERCIEAKPDWAKGFSRKGSALFGLNRYEEAVLAYQATLDLEPNNRQAKEMMAEAQAKLTGPAGSQPINNPFMMPDLWEKLEKNPQTRELMKQPDYRELVEDLRRNPLNPQRMQDPRVLATLGAMLGVDLDKDSMPTPPKADEQSASKNGYEPVHQSQSTSSTPNQSASTETPQSKSGPSSQALQEKDKGNEAYKKKDFETALGHYNKAFELDPTNITFLTNKAAVYFEKGDFDQCIEVCQKAVDVGRENRADYKLIAKAYARIGNAYLKKEDLESALNFYNKSVSEHRTPEQVKKIQEVKKLLEERKRLEYLNPELALEEKNKGNEFFKKGDYPQAIKHYNEAIKRNPDDPKIYSNRAACYTKLAEFRLALKDCEECIKLDPNFVKGYLRKGACCLGLKDSTGARQAYEKALEMDPNNDEARNGYRSAVVAEGQDPEAIKKRAEADPEIKQILSDPAMQLILQQMQTDPKALQDHLKNPEIASKISKLLECGIIAIR